MLRLCLKDWFAARWFWLGSIPVFGLYIVQPGFLGMVLPVLGAGLVFANLAVLFAIDERSGTERLYASLPVLRKDFVRARYVLAGLHSAAGSGLVFGSLPFLLALARGRGEVPASGYLLTFEGAAAFLLALALGILLFLPLAFRYGFGGGILRFAFVSGGLLLPAGVFAGPALARSGAGDPLAGAVNALAAVRASMGTPLFSAAALVAMAALAYVSLVLSVKAYERREL